MTKSPRRVARLPRVVEDDAQGVPAAGAETADAVAEVDSIGPSRALHGPVMDREDHSVPLVKIDHLGAGLHPGALLGQHELAAGKVLAGHREEKGDLQREGEIAVQILVQAVEIPLPVLQQERVGRVWPASWQRSRYSA